MATTYQIQNREWRLNNLYYIIDKFGKKVIFKMNWAQRILYNNLWYLCDILKARQLGITTFFCIYFLDAALFNSYTSCGIIAHNRDDAEKFFDKKVRFAYDNLPIEIKNTLKATSDTAKQLKFSNGSIINVGTSLRSDTLQFLHISEYGKTCAKFPEKAKEIRTGAINTVQAGNFLTIESTAEGPYGDFFNITKAAQAKALAGAKLSKLDFRFFFFPWQKHPEYKLPIPTGQSLKDLPEQLKDYFDKLEKIDKISLASEQKWWYFKKWEIQQDEMTREYPTTPEEAFAIPLRGAFYEMQIRRLISERRLTKVPYDESIPVHTVWDLGIFDQMAIWFVQIVGSAIHFIDFYSNTDKGFLHYKKMLDKKGYLYGQHIGPSDLNMRQHTDKEVPETRTEVAARVGINFSELPQEQDVLNGINRTRAMFNRFWFDAENCCRGEKSGFSGIQLYSKQWNEKMSCYDDKPIKNWTRNPADALRYVSLAVQEGFFDNNWYDEYDRSRWLYKRDKARV